MAQLILRLAGGLAVAGERAEADRRLAPPAAIWLDPERDAALDGEALDERREGVGDELGRRDTAQRGLAQGDDERLARDALVALSSARLWSVRSRTKPVCSAVGPAPAIRVIASSPGKSEPPARWASSSMRCSKSRPASPSSRRRSPLRWASRKTGGMLSSAMSAPMTSSRM